MKAKFRKQILARRKALSSQDVERASQRIQEYLVTLLHSKPACMIGLYHPFRNEPNLLSLLSNPQVVQHQWSLPVCVGQGAAATLQFARYTAHTDLMPGDYGIPVPAHLDWVRPQLVIIPCVGFNRSGGRLGYGAGWYDRTLALSHPKPLTWGVCFADDEIDDVFQETHDFLLDCVVTDQAIVDCNLVRNG